MIEDYNILVNECSDITNTFDISVISLDNIIIRGIMREFIAHKTVPHGNHEHIHYMGYAFVYKDAYHILITKDFYVRNNLFFIDEDYWGDHIDDGWFGEKDIFYIKNVKKYNVYRFDISWFSKEVNSDELCELEMRKIRPLIRKNKIRKLLI
jgi:hypothetical protein